MKDRLTKRLKRKYQHDSEDALMAPNGLDDFVQSQVDIPSDFSVVLNELASNNLEVKKQENNNGKD